MEGNLLTATSSASNQGSTKSPQTASSNSFLPGDKSSSVQTGTAQSTLDKSTAVGVPLGSASPNVISLAGTATTTSTKKEVIKEPHQTGPVAFGFSIIFIIAAVVLLVLVARPVKTTT